MTGTGMTLPPQRPRLSTRLSGAPRGHLIAPDVVPPGQLNVRIQRRHQVHRPPETARIVVLPIPGDPHTRLRHHVAPPAHPTTRATPPGDPHDGLLRLVDLNGRR